MTAAPFARRTLALDAGGRAPVARGAAPRGGSGSISGMVDPPATLPIHRVVCAWCGAVLQDGPGDLPVSHGMCGPCLADEGGFDVEDVATMSAERANRLPWGVIRLRGDGQIVAYNEAEAALSGLRPEHVVGKHFFRDVAPCTSVQQFEGRLAALRASGKAGVAEFEFVFRFPKHAVLVSVRMIYSAASDSAVLVIRRKG